VKVRVARERTEKVRRERERGEQDVASGAAK